LAEALAQAVHHTPYHQKAASLGALIRAEEGLTTAVTRIEETLAKFG
jgi:hypothetical protein